MLFYGRAMMPRNVLYPTFPKTTFMLGGLLPGKMLKNAFGKKSAEASPIHLSEYRIGGLEALSSKERENLDDGTI